MVEGHLRQRVTCGRGSPAAAGLSKALAFEPLPQVHTYIHTYTHTYIHRPTYLVGEAAKSTVAATSYALRPASCVLRPAADDIECTAGPRPAEGCTRDGEGWGVPTYALRVPGRDVWRGVEGMGERGGGCGGV